MKHEPSIVHLDGPALFRGRGRVQVYAKDGRPFYVFDKPKDYKFSLPAGSYVVSGGTLIARKLKRKGPRVNMSKLRFPLPRKVELVFTSTPPRPGPACIDLPNGVVYCQPWLKHLPAYCLTFVLLHEIAHYFHTTEEACDKFAAEEMYRRGWNPSQVELASRMTLMGSDRHACNVETALNL